MSRTYDLVGVGIGPFNLSLAALADPVIGLETAFFDAEPEFSWHPGLLIEGTTLQVPFLADLVTLADPTSRWSFLSYLREHDRLFPFYFAEKFHISRQEYEHYCRWVAGSLPSCRFGQRVTAVRWDSGEELFRVETEDVTTGERSECAARQVVLGVGTEPVVPEAFRDLVGADVHHASEYLDRRKDLCAAEDVTVIGSGQSGAEVVLDLLGELEGTGQRLRWYTRSRAFAPMEYSKLGLEHFTPDYTRYFRTLPQETRDRLVPQQWQLYKAGSASTLAAIHDLLYERGVGGRMPDATLMPNVAVTGARRVADGIELDCHHAEQDCEFSVRTEKVVLATGFAARRPSCLDPLVDVVDWDEQGRYQVGDDYRVALHVPGSLYVQNAEMHTHGVGAPDLGLGAHRAASILNTASGHALYPLPERTAYTTFGAAG